MKLIKRQRKLTFPLIILVIIIWGIVLYRVIFYFSFTDEDMIISEDISNDNSSITEHNFSMQDTIPFIELSRDPFVFTKIEKPPINTHQEKKISTKKIPPEFSYNINGVIINDKQRMVVIEDLSNHQTIFLREGDIYKSIKVRKIDTNILSLIENGEPKEVKIQ